MLLDLHPPEPGRSSNTHFDDSSSGTKLPAKRSQLPLTPPIPGHRLCALHPRSLQSKAPTPLEIASSLVQVLTTLLPVCDSVIGRRIGDWLSTGLLPWSTKKGEEGADEDHMRDGDILRQAASGTVSMARWLGTAP